MQRSGLPYEWHAIEQSFSSGAQQELDRLQSLREPPLPPPPAPADQPAAADGLAAPEARDALAAPVVPQPDPRDEEITVLQFRLRDRARSDFHRSVDFHGGGLRAQPGQRAPPGARRPRVLGLSYPRGSPS